MQLNAIRAIDSAVVTLVVTRSHPVVKQPGRHKPIRHKLLGAVVKRSHPKRQLRGCAQARRRMRAHVRVREFGFACLRVTTNHNLLYPHGLRSIAGVTTACLPPDYQVDYRAWGLPGAHMSATPARIAEERRS